MASPVKQHVQLSLFITGGDYGRENATGQSNTVLKRFSCFNPGKKISLALLSSQFTVCPLKKAVVVWSEVARQKAALSAFDSGCVDATLCHQTVAVLPQC